MSRYNLAIVEEAEQAFQYLTTLNGRECEVEIKRVTKRRSLPQNAYLHLLLGMLGLELGYTLEEMKAEYKRTICPSIYVYEKNGKHFTRSSADLDSEQMMRSIDKLRTWAAERGYELPDAENHDAMRQLENQVEKGARYL
jgi:hypothetical protein